MFNFVGTSSDLYTRDAQLVFEVFSFRGVLLSLAGILVFIEIHIERHTLQHVAGAIERS